MRYKAIIRKIVAVLFCVIHLICLISCGDNNESDPVEIWTIYPSPVEGIRSLRYFHPHLYVCAGVEDVWQLDVSLENPDWVKLSILDEIGTSDYGIYDIVVFGENNGIMMVSRPTNNPLEHSIFVSQNSGQTWSSSDSGIFYTSNQQYIDNIFVLLKIGSSILAGGANIYSSTNGGLNWNFKTSVGVNSTRCIEQSFCSQNVVWAVGMDFYTYTVGKVSEDYGENWDVLSFSEFGAWEIAFSCDDSDKVYIASEFGLIYTPNNGQTWSDPVIIDTTHNYYHDYISLIWIDPENAERIIVGVGDQLYESDNSGSGWLELATPIENNIVRSVYDPISNLLFIHDGSAAYKYVLNGGD